MSPSFHKNRQLQALRLRQSQNSTGLENGTVGQPQLINTTDQSASNITNGTQAANLSINGQIVPETVSTTLLSPAALISRQTQNLTGLKNGTVAQPQLINTTDQSAGNVTSVTQAANLSVPTTDQTTSNVTGGTQAANLSAPTIPAPVVHLNPAVPAVPLTPNSGPAGNLSQSTTVAPVPGKPLQIVGTNFSTLPKSDAIKDSTNVFRSGTLGPPHKGPPQPDPASSPQLDSTHPHPQSPSHLDQPHTGPPQPDPALPKSDAIKDLTKGLRFLKGEPPSSSHPDLPPPDPSQPNPGHTVNSSVPTAPQNKYAHGPNNNATNKDANTGYADLTETTTKPDDKTEDSMLADPTYKNHQNITGHINTPPENTTTTKPGVYSSNSSTPADATTYQTNLTTTSSPDGGSDTSTLVTLGYNNTFATTETTTTTTEKHTANNSYTGEHTTTTSNPSTTASTPPTSPPTTPSTSQNGYVRYLEHQLMRYARLLSKELKSPLSKAYSLGYSSSLNGSAIGILTMNVSFSFFHSPTYI